MPGQITTTGNTVSRNEDGNDLIKYLYTMYYPIDQTIKLCSRS